MHSRYSDGIVYVFAKLTCGLIPSMEWGERALLVLKNLYMYCIFGFCYTGVHAGI